MVKNRLCARTIWSIYAWLAIRDITQRAYWPWERELENRSCFPLFLLSPFSPTPASNSEAILMMAENTFRRKESSYPCFSLLSWIRLLMAWRRAGGGTRVERGQGRAGQSLQQKPYSQHGHFCLLYLHYKPLVALIPKHHQCIFPRQDLLVTCYLPINRPILSPLCFLEYIFFKCHTQWATDLLLYLTGNSLLSLLFPFLQKNCLFIKNKIILWDRLIAMKLLRNHWQASKPDWKLHLASYQPAFPAGGQETPFFGLPSAWQFTLLAGWWGMESPDPVGYWVYKTQSPQVSPSCLSEGI